MFIEKKMQKYLKSAGSIVLSAALVCSMTACGTETKEAAKTDSILSETELALEEQLTKQVQPSHSSTNGKEETVYVLADANGNTQKVIVSDWLKNGAGSAELSDCTNLNEVENVKGEEPFTKDGESLNWQANGSDIYYQGTTNKQLPVEVKLSYTLDGKEITPQELAGKSGKVTIRLDYINHSSQKVMLHDKETQVQVPFVLLSGVVLPENIFSNISVTNGKVLSEGSNSVVLGFAVPGLKDTLKLDDLEGTGNIEIPEYMEISADAVNFELGMTLTVAMSDLLSDSNLLEGASWDELQNSMNDLQDATMELEDGSVSLKAGADTLAEGTDSLVKGAGELKEGAVTLKDGTQELYEKSGELDNGAKKLADGASQLTTGAGQLAGGIGELSTGVGQLSTGASALTGGLGQAEAGIKALQAALETGAATKEGTQPAILTGAQAVDDAAGALNTLLNEYFEKYATDLNALIDMLLQKQQENSTALETAKEQLASAQTARDAALDTLNQACNGQAQQIETVTAIETNDVSGNDAQVTTVVNDITVCQPEVLKNAAQIYSDSEAQVAACQANVSALETQAADLQSQLAQLKGLLQMNRVPEVQAEQGSYIALIKTYAGQLSQGTKALYTGLMQLDGGIKQLTNQETGVPALSKGAGELSAGISKMKNGADALTKGAGDLKTGAAVLGTGTTELKDGTVKLVEGANTLNTGAGTLKAGITTLYDGAASLDEGALELAAGCLTLKDGLFQFDEEGIRKLVSLAGDDTQETMERLNAVLDAGKEYKTFTKLSDGMDGSVKFIIKTDEVKMK